MSIVLTAEMVAAQADQARRATKKARILSALQAAGPLGVTNATLNAITYRYTGRVQELRDAGYDIESIDDGDGRWRFVLRRPDPQPGPRTHQARRPRRVFGPEADRIVAEAGRILRARRSALAALPRPATLF